MTALLDTLNGGPRVTRAQDARAGLWLAGAIAVALGLVAILAHLAFAVPPGQAIAACGALGVAGFAGALVLEWKLGRGDDDDSDDDGPPQPEGPSPEDDPVDWEPFERLLRDASESREPVPA